MGLQTLMKQAKRLHDNVQSFVRDVLDPERFADRETKEPHDDLWYARRDSKRSDEYISQHKTSYCVVCDYSYEGKQHVDSHGQPVCEQHLTSD